MKASRIVALCLAVLALLAVPAASAQILPTAAPPPAEAAASTANQTIAAEQTSGTDARIAGRIRGIFSELPSLAAVTVEVQQGVVILGGTVATAADKARAEGIASRVAGVATIENGIARDTSVGGGVAGLKKVSQKFASLAGELPLIGAALLVALIVGVVGYALAGLGPLWRHLARNVFLAELIASAIRFVFVLGGVIVALNMIGAGALMGAVLGGAGVIGIALGFAMRDTIENYVSSLMLSLRQPFRANDHVVIDAHEGRVVRLTTRATILMTPDGNHLRLPNAMVFKAVIMNYTRNPQRRFDFVLQIDTKADPTQARHCGLAALTALDFVLDQPAPAVVVKDVLYPNIAIQFLAWIDQSRTDLGKARSRAIATVKQAFEANGLAIPDPITHVRMEPDGRPAREAPASAPAPAEEADVAPEKAVATMVDEERAQTPGKRDLLDASRPVE
jgi:small-conductance mechanosensitive channel